MRPAYSTVAALTGVLLPVTAWAQAVIGDEIDPRAIIDLSDWRYGDLCRGISAERLIDDGRVYGAEGEEIGDVEDIIVDDHGRVLSMVAEIGGLWDIGDTHVSIPWESVELLADSGGVTVPVTQDTISDYSLAEQDYLASSTAASGVDADVEGMDLGPRAWRVTELVGDYVRLHGSNRAYGYVDDVLLLDGRIGAVIVDADQGAGDVGALARGGRAYPFYGYDRGRSPGAPYYDLPYAAADVPEMGRFDDKCVGVR